jgi:hypothetical protein
LEGSLLTPANGDRTIAGKALTGVNGIAFEHEVPLQGGFNFMRGPAQQAEQAAWASRRGLITTLANRIKRLSESGDPVHLVYSAMGLRDSDFSDMTTRAIRELMKTAEVTRRAKAELDDAMRQPWDRFRAYKDFPGIDSITDAWLATAGRARTKLAKLLDTDRFADLNFPDMGSIRKALTEPELLWMPTGASGSAIARMDPTGRVIRNPQVPHTSYDTQIGGTYVGSLPPIPRRLMFPDWMSTRDPGEHPWLTQRAFHQQTVTQRANQQWLEGIMNYLKAIGLHASAAVDAGLLTQAQADDLGELIDRRVI